MSATDTELNDNVIRRLGSYLFEPVTLWLTDILLDITDAFDSIDSFQWKILRAFLIIICMNLIFISFAWKKYGDKIGERFMKPLSKQTLEALKQEAHALKLPSEHTPRI